MPIRHLRHTGKEGFTLIELSIVLVVVGLIFGGILVGRDLIHAADVRATISQIEKYNAAVNTFKTKYNALPGDILAANASAFGLFAETTLAGTPGHEDGDGVIGLPGTNDIDGEYWEFWRHLSDSNLIDGLYGADLNPTTGKGPFILEPASNFLPSPKIDRTISIFVKNDFTQNYFGIAGNGGRFIGGVHFLGQYPSVRPTDSYMMDMKIDDGFPNTGRLTAGYNEDIALFLAPTVAAVSTANKCTIGSGLTSDTYNLLPSTGGFDPSCGLRFKVQW